MQSFKYSINTNALKKKMSPAEIVSLALDCNLDGIEWGIRSIDTAATEVREMKKRTEDAGLEIVNWLVGGKPWKQDDIKRRAELAASIGGKSMRVDHPWVAFNFNESLHQEKSFNEIMKLAKDSMPLLTKLSEETGVRFLFETHAGTLLASTLAAKILFEGVSPQHVGIIYDPANTLAEGNLRPRSEVEVLGGYLAYVHAKNTAFFCEGESADRGVNRKAWGRKTVPPDEGALDWLEVFFALKCGSFAGFISSEEYFSPENTEIIKKKTAFLRECGEKAPDKIQLPFTTFND
jgi:sugar phosphate isomerase/epimerase